MKPNDLPRLSLALISLTAFFMVGCTTPKPTANSATTNTTTNCAVTNATAEVAPSKPAPDRAHLTIEE